jgi:hemoglobin/transferrin/lactoferrin receptor protein
MAVDVQSAPWTVRRLDAESVTTSAGVRTTPDALRGIPSAMVQKTGYGQGSPFLRGFTGFRTLCLIEGVRLNNSVFRDGPNQYWNTVDALSVADYELVMGPASVLYGSDAIGGVLNALTVEPPDYADTAVWDRRLFYRAASADESHVGRIQVGGRPTRSLGFVGGISLKDFGDLEGGRDVGKQPHTGYGEMDFDARMDWYLGERSRLTLAHQSVDQDDAWRTHRTIHGIEWEGLTRGDDKVHTYDQHRDLTYLRCRSESPGFVDGVDATVSRHVQTEDLYRVRKDDKRDRQGFDVETWGASVQLTSRTRAGEWVYGAEYYRDGVDSYSHKYKADGSFDKAEVQGPVADDASYDTIGAYAQDTARLLDGNLDVTVGGRYTFARADADKVKDPITGGVTSLSDDWNALSASLRLLHPLTPDRRHVVFAGVSQGFRAPNLSDLTRLDIARSGELETPSPGLDPEDYVAYEAGLKCRTERIRSQLSYYYTAVDNMIVRTPTGRTIDTNTEVAKRNSGAGYVQGVELATRCRFSDRWSSWLNAAWMDGEMDAYPTSADEKRRDYISRLMPPTAQIGVRWQTPAGRFWTEVVGDAAAKADKLSADDKRDTQRIPPGGTPGYAVCAIRGGARIAGVADLSLSVENVFDEDYRIHGSGVNEPGRNVIAAVNGRF